MFFGRFCRFLTCFSFPFPPPFLVQTKKQQVLLTGDEEYELAKQYKYGMMIQRQVKLLERQSGRSMTMGEIADYFGISIDKVKTILGKCETARRILIRTNLRLIFHIAKFFKNRGIPEHDLVSEGTFGLLRACEKYDPERGFRFSTYSTWWIKQSITRAITEKSRVVRVPSHIHEVVMKLVKIEKKFIEKYNRKPSDDELCVMLDIPKPKLKTAQDYLQDVGSTEEIMFQNNAKGSQSDASVKDVVLSEEEELFDVADDITSQWETEFSMIDLSSREVAVMALRYGFDDGHIMTLDEVGEEIDLTKERIRQLENRAMIKLRDDELVPQLDMTTFVMPEPNLIITEEDFL